MKFNFHNNETNKINPAIISKNDINYNQYYNSVQETVKILRTFQFKPDEKIAIFAEKNESFFILLIAFLQIGIIVVPINQSVPMNQMLQLLSSINCNKLFINDISKAFLPDSDIDIFKINEFILDTISDISAFKLKPISFEQNSTIIFTSGSSGKSKAVLHTFGNHYFSALGSNENIPFKSGDKWLLSLPLFHVGGLSIFFRALVGEGTVVIPDENLDLVENINKYNVTHISLVPAQLIKLLENEDSLRSLQKLKCILIGGSSIPSDLIEKSIKYKLSIYTTYGLTEMASQVTTSKSNELPEKLFTSGNLLQYRELKTAEDGEILVKGKTLFKGLIENDKLVKPFDSQGWYHTGDLGALDHDNYLTIIGRKDNMFISGGENIYPEEIEQCLMNMNNIEEAVVFDIPNKKYGSRPVAFLKSENYHLIKRTNIIKHLTKYLPKFKIPDAFYKWPAQIRSLKPNRSDFILLNKNQASEEIE